MSHKSQVKRTESREAGMGAMEAWMIPQRTRRSIWRRKWAQQVQRRHLHRRPRWVQGAARHQGNRKWKTTQTLFLASLQNPSTIKLESNCKGKKRLEKCTQLKFAQKRLCSKTSTPHQFFHSTYPKFCWE